MWWGKDSLIPGVEEAKMKTHWHHEGWKEEIKTSQGHGEDSRTLGVLEASSVSDNSRGPSRRSVLFRAAEGR